MNKRTWIGALAALCVVAAAACGGSGGGGAAGAVKGTGKNYTLSKESDFKYELTKIDGVDYVVIQDVNLPEGFKEAEKGAYQTSINGFALHDMILVDTLTVKVPEKIEGYTVGVIGEHALGGISITAVTLPDTVLEIGNNALEMASISTIKFPKNLKKLGEYAFSNCESLGGSITIPEGITEIPASVFISTKITEVVIPDSVSSIGGEAFKECKELENVKLPSHPITYQPLSWSPENNAFLECGKLSLATRKAIEESGYKDKFAY